VGVARVDIVGNQYVYMLMFLNWIFKCGDRLDRISQRMIVPRVQLDGRSRHNPHRAQAAASLAPARPACRALIWGGTIRPTPQIHPRSTRRRIHSANERTRYLKASSPCVSSFPSRYGATTALLLPSLAKVSALTPRRRKSATTTARRYGVSG